MILGYQFWVSDLSEDQDVQPRTLVGAMVPIARLKFTAPNQERIDRTTGTVVPTMILVYQFWVSDLIEDQG